MKQEICISPEVVEQISALICRFAPFKYDDSDYLTAVLIAMVDGFNKSYQSSAYDYNAHRNTLFGFWVSALELSMSDWIKLMEHLFQIADIQLYIAHIICDFWYSLSESSDYHDNELKQMMTALYQKAMFWLMQFNQESINADGLVVLSAVKN